MSSVQSISLLTHIDCALLRVYFCAANFLPNTIDFIFVFGKKVGRFWRPARHSRSTVFTHGSWSGLVLEANLFLTFYKECAWWDSNPQTLARRLLRRQLCLPVSPHAHFQRDEDRTCTGMRHFPGRLPSYFGHLV